MIRGRLCVSLLLSVLSTTTSVAAQSAAPFGARVLRRIPQTDVRPASSPRSSLKSRFGLSVAKALLQSGSESDRLRAIERLGSVGSAPALATLIEALAPDGPAQGPKERLTAARALAPHAHEPDVRQALLRLMASSDDPVAAADDDYAALIRQTAALGLARFGGAPAMEALSRSLRQRGPLAEAAAQAVLAYPPKQLAPLLAARGRPTVSLIRLLSELGDQRAFHSLRDWVKRGSPEIRAEATLALTRLGDLETVPLAEHWLAHEKNPTLLRAAAQTLALTRAKSAPKAILRLLEDDAEFELGLKLALSVPSEAFVPTLTKRWKERPSARAGIVSAVARAGGPAAHRFLDKMLASPKTRRSTLYALALSPGRHATEVLETALANPKQQRDAARAGVVRQIVTGEQVSGLAARLSELLSSKQAADRAAGAWGQAVLSESRAEALLDETDVVIVRAVARTARFSPLAAVAARKLAEHEDPITRTALAAALCVPGAAALVPTRTLTDLLELGGPASVAAVRALSARWDPRHESRIEEFLSHENPELRAHAAIGLAHNPDPFSVALLDKAYTFETASEVRHAIITALGQRREPGRRRALRLAAALDPDRRVRGLARASLAGQRPSWPTRGVNALWIDLGPNRLSTELRAAKPQGNPQIASIRVAPGQSFPAVSDPDGLLAVTGLVAGGLSLELAAPPLSDNASGKQRKP